MLLFFTPLLHAFPAIAPRHDVDVFMTTSTRPDGTFYLPRTLDGWTRQALPNGTEFHVYARKWFEELTRVVAGDSVHVHVVDVVDPFAWRDDQVTAANRGHAVDAHGRMQTYTVLAGIADLRTRSTAEHILLTEDDWVPCPDALPQILAEVSLLPTRMSSYRCAYGLGCLVVRSSTLDAFVYWAALNGFVTPIDSLSSIFYTREDTSAMPHKFGLGSHVYDGNSAFAADELPYVKRRLPLLHIGKVSTFQSKHHISYTREFACGDPFDVHSPVVRNGAPVEAVAQECETEGFSPCDAVSVERLMRLLVS